jgi:hypothetical protein
LDGDAADGALSADGAKSSLMNSPGVFGSAEALSSGRPGASSGAVAAAAAGAVFSSGGSGGMVEKSAAISGRMKVGTSPSSENRSLKLPVTSSGTSPAWESSAYEGPTAQTNRSATAKAAAERTP